MTRVCLIIEVLSLKDTRREEASGRSKMEDGPVFKLLFTSSLIFGMSLRLSGS